LAGLLPRHLLRSQPAQFLVNQRQEFPGGVGIALLAGLLIASWPLTVKWVATLARSLASDRQTGEVNPSALGILDGILGVKHRALALSLFVLYDCAVALAAFPLIRRLSQRGSPEEWVMVAITLWILLSPRVMIYSYVLMIVPALFVLRHGIAGPLARALGYVLLMVQGLIRLLPGRPPAALAEGPFLLTLAIFALLLARVASTGSLILPLRRPRNR